MLYRYRFQPENRIKVQDCLLVGYTAANKNLSGWQHFGQSFTDHATFLLSDLSKSYRIVTYQGCHVPDGLTLQTSGDSPENLAFKRI